MDHRPGPPGGQGRGVVRRPVRAGPGRGRHALAVQHHRHAVARHLEALDGQLLALAAEEVVDTDTDTLVKSLPCDAGCHGVNFAAKHGGGYLAYVSSKFSNSLIVVDPDPNNDGEPTDAAVIGRVVLTAGPGTRTDDHVIANAGMGGQGVLPIPLVYNGWVQNVPNTPPFNQLTCEQRNPLGGECS